MVLIHTLDINPPLLNSSCAWASDLTQLRELYDSPFTGAVTTRTATLNGYAENASNTVVFTKDRCSTLNSYGYSPHPLSEYLDWIHTLLTSPLKLKPIILSITTSSPTELLTMLTAIQALRTKLGDTGSPTSLDPATRLAVELNTSCPNIPGAPPPSYALTTLRPLLAVLADAARGDASLTIGLKLPPYPDPSAPPTLLAILHEHTIREPEMPERSPVAFLTCTNTLGSSVLFADQVDAPAAEASAYALPTAQGGLGGALLHPLALGTVRAFAAAIAAHPAPAVRALCVVGVGGVTDRAAAARMRTAGACAVGCATLLGREGVRAFELLAEAV